MKYGNITYTGTNEVIGERLKKIVEENKRNDYLLRLGKITEWMYKRDYTLQAWGVSIDTIEELLEYEEDAEKNNE